MTSSNLTGLVYFKQFQINRLRQTYADFIDQQAYTAACEFFFGDIYSVNDTEARDAAFKAFTKKISLVLGGDIVTCLQQLVSLQQLTHSLDQTLFQKLVQMEVSNPFTMSEYRRAYRACQNYEARQEQITELVGCLNLSHRILSRVGIGPGLIALHRFQKIRGKGLATGLLVRGYHALSPLPDINVLTQAIKQRETAWLDETYRF